MSENSNQADYHFKFKINKDAEYNRYNFNDFIKEHIQDMLSFCELYDDTGKCINVHAFRLKHSGENSILLFEGFKEKILSIATDTNISEDEKALYATEPRIGYIIKLIRKLNRLVNLYSMEKKCDISEIELKNCSDWLVNERGHAAMVYQHLAYTCNANCKFCYLQANPTTIRIGKKEKEADCSRQELMTRIKYLEDNTTLFNTNYEIKEFFNSPYFEDTLRELRKKRNDEFTFVTNGTLLTEEKVKFLSTVKPVTLIISVIVISEKKRTELLFNDTQQDNRENLNKVMMQSFELLNKYKIPFIGSITAWPTIKYEDFIETIHYLEKFNPVAIRINMLGYTDKNEPIVPIDEQFWYEFCEFIKRANDETEVPLIPIPSQYYINEFQDNIMDVQVMGIVKNSPADGILKKGDIITKINDMQITSREQLLRGLEVLPGVKKLTVIRNNNKLDLTLSDNVECYPYVGNYYGKYQFPYGIVIPESIQLKQIKKIIEILEKYDKRNALLIIGPLLKKTVLEYFKMLGAQANDNCIKINKREVQIIESKNYFLGGNIKIMDMCVIPDFIQLIEENKDDNTDIVILPDSMFNIWGNDLLGINKDSLEKCIGIPVEYFSAISVPY